jgi:hypothetical protein
MARPINPWERLYDEIRVVRQMDRVYVPPVPDADLDHVEAQLEFRLPHSYRAFMKRFGPGRLLGFWLFPVTSLKTSSKGTLIDVTRHFREALARYPEENANPAWRRGLIFFASYGPYDFAWDSAAVTQTRSHECRVYSLCDEEERQPEALGDSFWQFVEWVDAGSRNPRNPFRSGEGGLSFTPAELRVKKRPLKREVKPWLAWNNGTVLQLARTIREQWRTEGFPAGSGGLGGISSVGVYPKGTAVAQSFTILADALEDAGCTIADLLDSCRRGIPEVDGLWVLQILLGKE